MSASPTARTAHGHLLGGVEDGVCVFRGVPYAAAPVGPLRFQPPQPAPSWTGMRDATRHGPVPPQPASRLRAAMGDFDRPQDEDCLTLTIATPAADGGKRPVLVWFHGGAFWTGAGSLDWYSGVPMARAGDVVVVGVNYRLGALGFMHAPDVAPPNLGLLDQFAALEWVGEQIAAFGGDPDNITVFGQSAGGLSVLAMLALPRVRARFRRAIVQSAPFGRMLRPVEGAVRVAAAMQRELGITEAGQWRDASADAINAAQLRVARGMASFANSTPAFIPVADHDLIGDDIVPAALAGAAERDVMVGCTRDEMAAFLVPDEAVRNASPDAVLGVFRRFFGGAAESALAEYRERARGGSPTELLGELLGDASFQAGTFAFAERLAALGRPAWAFRFDWAPPGSPYLACHCGELPFMFDTLPAWQAPMLAGGDPAAMRTLAAQMRDAWIAFARSGDPNHAGLPRWSRYEAAGQTMLFDAPSRQADDPAGRRRWRFWP